MSARPCPRAAPRRHHLRSPKLARNLPAVPPPQAPRTTSQPRPSLPLPAQCRGGGDLATAPVAAPAAASEAAPFGLARLNSVPADAAEASLLTCCGSRRWARRLADHRPYPDLGALLAAADEAAYDLRPCDLAEALAGEGALPQLPPSTPVGSAARTALHAAHAAYEARFGHAFVICLDATRPAERLDQVLAGIRARLGNEPEEERVVAADELRGIARARLIRLVRTGSR